VAWLVVQRGLDSERVRSCLTGHVRSLKTRSGSLMEVIGLHVVERPVILTASQVVEWLAWACAGADAAAVCLVMCLVRLVRD
jgi:hypothetical protein